MLRDHLTLHRSRTALAAAVALAFLLASLMQAGAAHAVALT